MTEIVQSVKTVFKADSGPLQAEMAKIRAMLGQTSASMGAFADSVEQELAELLAAEDKVAKASSSTRDLWSMTADEVEQELGGCISEIDGLLSQSTTTMPAVSALGDETKKAGKEAGASGGLFKDFSKQVKDAAAPADRLRGAFNLVKENMFFVGGAIYGVVEAFDWLDKAVSNSDEIATKYAESVKGLGNELARVAQLNRDIAIATGREQAPTDNQQRLEQIQGTGRFDEGEWAKLRAREADIQARVDDLQGQARRMGIPLTAGGNVPTGWTPNINDPAQVMTLEALSEDGGLGKALRELADVGEQIAELERSRLYLVEEEANEQRMAAIAAGLEAAKISTHLADAAEDAGKIGGNLMRGFASLLSDVKKSGEGIWSLFDQEAQQKRQEDAADFWFNLTGVKNPRLAKTNIDARGSKITVNVPKIETDDPARFAAASVEGAFVGLVARPLSATFGLGSPPLATGAPR